MGRVHSFCHLKLPIFKDQKICQNELKSLNQVHMKFINVVVEARHATVKLLLFIYGRLDERALRVGKPISSSARSQAFYSSIVCTSTL